MSKIKKKLKKYIKKLNNQKLKIKELKNENNNLKDSLKWKQEFMASLINGI